MSYALAPTGSAQLSLPNLRDRKFSDQADFQGAGPSYSMLQRYKHRALVKGGG
jgi:hypothetical protein